MGGDWRMPTQADWEELCSGTINVWVNNYNGSGKNGRLFTSNTNGNTMFMPAAGFRMGFRFEFRGMSGGVWCHLLSIDKKVQKTKLISGLFLCFLNFFVLLAEFGSQHVYHSLNFFSNIFLISRFLRLFFEIVSRQSSPHSSGCSKIISQHWVIQ